MPSRSLGCLFIYFTNNGITLRKEMKNNEIAFEKMLGIVMDFDKSIARMNMMHLFRV